MATYLVNAPNRSAVSVSCKLGQYNFRHQQVMYDDKLADMFPTIFQKISNDSPAQPEVKQVVEEPVQEVVVPVVEEPVQEITPEPEMDSMEEYISEDEDESMEGDLQEEDNNEDTPVTFVQKKRGRKSKGN